MRTVNRFVFGMFFVGLAVCLTSCWTPPGKGRKAEAGYKAAGPIIAALEKFHEQRGHYPAGLSELVPGFLPEQPSDKHLPNRFFYRDGGDTYDLAFRYVGPGVNTCWYDPKTKSWRASGCF